MVLKTLGITDIDHSREKFVNCNTAVALEQCLSCAPGVGLP